MPRELGWTVKQVGELEIYVDDAQLLCNPKKITRLRIL
jgi:hypothetical protein